MLHGRPKVVLSGTKRKKCRSSHRFAGYFRKIKPISSLSRPRSPVWPPVLRVDRQQGRPWHLKDALALAEALASGLNSLSPNENGPKIAAFPSFSLDFPSFLIVFPRFSSMFLDFPGLLWPGPAARTPCGRGPPRSTAGGAAPGTSSRSPRTPGCLQAVDRRYIFVITKCSFMKHSSKLLYI